MQHNSLERGDITYPLYCRLLRKIISAFNPCLSTPPSSMNSFLGDFSVSQLSHKTFTYIKILSAYVTGNRWDTNNLLRCIITDLMKAAFKAEYCSPPWGIPFLFSALLNLSAAINGLDFILLAIFPPLFNPLLLYVANSSILIKENLEYIKYYNIKKHSQLCHHVQFLKFWRCFDLSFQLLYINLYKI